MDEEQIVATEEPRKRRVTRAEWYRRVNAAWPNPLPKLTGEEAVRAGKKLYRFGFRRPFRGKVRVTSGRRYTWIRRGEMAVNPDNGWHELVHDISHYVHSRLRHDERPHGSSHARLELRMIKEVIKRGWLNGSLKTEPKPKPVKDDAFKLARLQAREKAWIRRSRRAATALRKIAASIKRLERRKQA